MCVNYLFQGEKETMDKEVIDLVPETDSSSHDNDTEQANLENAESNIANSSSHKPGRSFSPDLILT